jgi:hypothetical protein
MAYGNGIYMTQVSVIYMTQVLAAGHRKTLTRIPCFPTVQIFEMDEAKRIDIAGIRQHPWFSAPMPSMYENALKALAAEQASISAVVDAQPLSKVCRRRL